MIQDIKDWFANKALAQVAATLAKVIVSYELAHAGVISQWGANVSLDPNQLTLVILGGLAWVYHKVIGASTATPAQ